MDQKPNTNITTRSERIENPILKSLEEANSTPLTHKYMTSHCHDLQDVIVLPVILVRLMLFVQCLVFCAVFC